MRLSHKNFYRNTFWQYGLQLIKYLFPFITLPYLTRVLEPEGYAVYAFVLAYMTFVQLFVDFGFNLSGTKQIAASDNSEKANRIFGAITQARLLLCAIAALFVVFVSGFIEITASHYLYTLLAFVAVCGRALAPDFIFQGKEQMRPITSRYFASKGISTALTFVFVHSVNDLLWIPVLDILASVVAFVWSVASAAKLFGIRIRFVSITEVWRELKDSSLYCLSNLSSAIFTGFTTLLIGLVFGNSPEVAYWSLATTCVTAVQSLYTPITNSLYPHMVISQDYRFAKKLMIIAFPFVLIGTVLFAGLSEFIMVVLGGESYVAGAYILVYISPVLPLSFYAMLFGWPILGAIGRVSDVTKSTMISALVCVSLLLVLFVSQTVDMRLICIVRCLSELILFVLRALCARRAIRGRE